jgi:hypothetical protein
MLCAKNTVPLPESGIIVRRSDKYNYVYKVMSVFRDNKGRPTNTRKLIGRLDPSGAKLIPNNNYYEFYGVKAETELELSYNEVVSIGAHFLVTDILSKLGVSEILVSSFGESQAKAICTAATYMVSEGNVFEYVGNWCERSMLGGVPLSPQKASALFASLEYEGRMAFFKKWVNANMSQGYFSYDVTSFSSYAKGIHDLEWGYNRDGDKLPQINLGCYLAQENRLPMFYVTYPGSIVDKSHMTYMMAYNDDLGISKDIVYVMDRGFCSTTNVNYLHSEGLSYLIGVDLRCKATQTAIDSVKERIGSMRNLVGESVYSLSVHSRFYGESSTLHVFFNPELGEQQRRDLLRVVANMEIELSQISKASSKQLKRFSRFFDVVQSDGVLSYSRNYDKIDTTAKNCGVFCILTNTALSGSDILSVYRRKDTIEKGFDDIKNHIDMKRMRVHTDAAVNGKLFCAFVALIVASRISNCLEIYNGVSDKRALTKRGLFCELEKIRAVTYSSGSRLMNPLTKTQRAILDAFDITCNDLTAYIRPETGMCKNTVEI